MAAPRKTATNPKPKPTEANEEAFEFTLASGATVTLPSMATAELTFRQRRTLTHAGEAAAMVLVLEWFADDDSLDALDDCTDTEIGELYKAWAIHSGASLGELSAS
jgi:hypothetical protein